MEYQCTEERFLSDVKEHEIEVVLDQGVNRHIRFKRKGSIYYWFDLITWNGNLCINGDCGAFVFARTEDMFNFFIMDENDFNTSKDKTLNINPHYWAEKLNSVERNGGYEEFSEELFKENVMQSFNGWSEDETPEKIKEVKTRIEEDIFPYIENEQQAYGLVVDSEDSDEIFTDFWEYSHKRYTFRYIWNLYAIVWGILEYRKLNQKGQIKVGERS